MPAPVSPELSFTARREDTPGEPAQGRRRSRLRSLRRTRAGGVGTSGTSCSRRERTPRQPRSSGDPSLLLSADGAFELGLRHLRAALHAPLPSFVVELVVGATTTALVRAE